MRQPSQARKRKLDKDGARANLLMTGERLQMVYAETKGKTEWQQRSLSLWIIMEYAEAACCVSEAQVSLTGLASRLTRFPSFGSFRPSQFRVLLVEP